jgi:FSR family fosmidomycin resistance protein-like MFS transporter
MNRNQKKKFQLGNVLTISISHLVQDVNSERPAFMNSIFMTISFLLTAVATMIVGIMGDHIGLERTFWISAFIGFGSLPFILKLKSKKD